MSDELVLRVGPGGYRGAGFWRRRGSLVLLPDKLAYVGSIAATTNLGGGLLGWMAGRGIANAQAPKKVASGHKSVTVIPLASITDVSVDTPKRGRANHVTVRVSSGEEYVFFAVPKTDEWLADLSRVFATSGRRVTAHDSGLSIL